MAAKQTKTYESKIKIKPQTPTENSSAAVHRPMLNAILI